MIRKTCTKLNQVIIIVSMVYIRNNKRLLAEVATNGN